MRRRSACALDAPPAMGTNTGSRAALPVISVQSTETRKVRSLIYLNNGVTPLLESLDNWKKGHLGDHEHDKAVEEQDIILGEQEEMNSTE